MTEVVKLNNPLVLRCELDEILLMRCECERISKEDQDFGPFALRAIGSRDKNQRRIPLVGCEDSGVEPERFGQNNL